MFFNLAIRGNFYNLAIGAYITQLIILDIVIRDLAPLISLRLLNNLTDFQKISMMSDIKVIGNIDIDCLKSPLISTLKFDKLSNENRINVL